MHDEFYHALYLFEITFCICRNHQVEKDLTKSNETEKEKGFVPDSVPTDNWSL